MCNQRVCKQRRFDFRNMGNLQIKVIVHPSYTRTTLSVIKDNFTLIFINCLKNNWIYGIILNKNRYGRKKKLNVGHHKKASYLEIVDIIKSARERAYSKVNEELILMYRQIGKYISEKTQSSSYGDSYV